MSEFTEKVSNWLDWLLRSALVLAVFMFGPLVVTFVIVYVFPEQYRWLVETTQPVSMWIAYTILDLVPLAFSDHTRFRHAVDVVFNSDNFFGCYVGVIAGSAISWHFRKRA